jgi:hypothetical protein
MRTHLARAYRHGIAHQTVHADRGQRHGHGGERRQHERPHLRRQTRHRQMARHRRGLEDLQVRIDFPGGGGSAESQM